MEPESDDLVQLATGAATAAGRVLLERQGGALRVETKTSATDPVSDADRASEALLVERLLGARPDDGLLGEEGADRPAASGVRWVLDPLDGTVNYLYGLPGWCVSVAAEEADGDGGWRPLAGVVHDPVRQETFVAARGAGAALLSGGRRQVLAVNDPVPLEHALVATGFAYAAATRQRQAGVVAALLPRVRDIRRVGSAALDLCWTAAGRVDGYFEDTMSPWDWAAGVLVAAEAGAVVSRLRDGVLAAGPALHPDLLAAVTAAP